MKSMLSQHLPLVVLAVALLLAVAYVVAKRISGRKPPVANAAVNRSVASSAADIENRRISIAKEWKLAQVKVREQSRE